MSGTVIHEEQLVFHDTRGPYVMTEVTHARKAADSAFHGPVTPVPGDGRYSLIPVRYTIPAGWCYRFQPGKFHRSIVDGPAVTLIRKLNYLPENISARVLHPIGSMVHAFGHDIDQQLVRSVLSTACTALSVVLAMK